MIIPLDKLLFYNDNKYIFTIFKNSKFRAGPNATYNCFTVLRC